jgi:micrococcal nuclease
MAAMARRRSWQWSLPGIVLVALLAAFLNLPDQAVTHGDFEVVERVVDGDTLLLASGERVRLIGVDTPETKHPNKQVQYFGKEASAFTRSMVEGKRVRLEFDEANATRGHKDNTHQKRTLAYVFLEDGTLLNAEIIKQGYGFALTRYPFSRMGDFRRLEREAQEQGRGLWAR